MRPPLIRVVPFLIPNWAWGKSVWHLVLLHRRALAPEHREWLPRLVAHELVHYDQWARYGFFGFLGRYVWGWASNGFDYQKIPLELEAWVLESDPAYLARARALIDQYIDPV